MTVVVTEEEEEEVAEEEEVWEGKESSCPVSEERREQERRSTVCREVQRRSIGTHCSVTFTQPETRNTVRQKQSFHSMLTMCCFTCELTLDVWRKLRFIF